MLDTSLLEQTGARSSMFCFVRQCVSSVWGSGHVLVRALKNFRVRKFLESILAYVRLSTYYTRSGTLKQNISSWYETLYHKVFLLTNVLHHNILIIISYHWCMVLDESICHFNSINKSECMKIFYIFEISISVIFFSISWNIEESNQIFYCFLILISI